jgi:hypothetical protein
MPQPPLLLRAAEDVGHKMRVGKKSINKFDEIVYLQLRTGLGVVRELAFRLPITAAD